MLLPSTCPICGATGGAPCADCLAELERAPLLPPPPQVDAICSLLAYDGAGRELVARLKYRNARSSVRWLATRMSEQVRAAGFVVDAVTWVPTSAERRHRRGFDQAEILARAVATRLGRPCRALLVRGPGPAQTGRSAAERRGGPNLRARRGPLPAAVLLVDDVVTTGVSVSAAARALRAAGVRSVAVASAARTPRHRA